MNLPNTLTVSRVILTFVAAILLCVPIKYATLVAFVAYTVAGITDWFDGYLARKNNIVTTFGKFMDALSDKVMVITTLLVLFALNVFGEWTKFALFCAIVSMSREFFVSGIRMIASQNGIVLAAERTGKYKAAFQMYSLGAIIFSRMLEVDFCSTTECFLYQLAFYTSLIALGISTLLSIISGYSYGRRYAYLFKA